MVTEIEIFRVLEKIIKSKSSTFIAGLEYIQVERRIFKELEYLHQQMKQDINNSQLEEKETDNEDLEQSFQDYSIIF